MAAVWPIGDYLDTLKTNLATRLTSESITNVEIYTAPVDQEEFDDDMEAVVLGIRVDTDEDVVAMKGSGGHRNEEANVIECQLMSWDIAGEGQSGEAVAKAARDRTLLIFGEVEKEIRLNFTQGQSYMKQSWISRKELNQGIYPNQVGRARACTIEFDITVIMRTNVAT